MSYCSLFTTLDDFRKPGVDQFLDFFLKVFLATATLLCRGFEDPDEDVLNVCSVIDLSGM